MHLLCALADALADTSKLLQHAARQTLQSLLSDWCFDTMQLFRILYKPLTSPSFYFINFQHENSHRCK